MFTKYKPKKIREEKVKIKDTLREWKQHDRNQYEKYKKEDQPVIDKLDDLVGKVDHIGKELIHSIENEHDNKQLVPKNMILMLILYFQYHQHHQNHHLKRNYMNHQILQKD